MACSIREIDKCACEREIEKHAEQREECDAAQAAHQQECEDSVQDTGTGNAFDGSNVGVDV